MSIPPSKFELVRVTTTAFYSGNRGRVLCSPFFSLSLFLSFARAISIKLVLPDREHSRLIDSSIFSRFFRSRTVDPWLITRSFFIFLLKINGFIERVLFGCSLFRIAARRRTPPPPPFFLEGVKRRVFNAFLVSPPCGRERSRKRWSAT